MLDRRHFLMSAGALALAGGSTAEHAVAAPPVPRATVAPLPSPAPSPQSASQQLSKLLDDFFQEQLVESPELATILGLDTGAHADLKAKLSEASFVAVDRRNALNDDQIRRLKVIDRPSLSGLAAVNYDTVLHDLESAKARYDRFSYGGSESPFVISQLTGAYQDAPDFMATQHTIGSIADCEAYIARLEALGRVMGEEIERVRRDAGLGVVPPDFVLKRALSQMKSMRVAADKSVLVTALAERAKAKGIVGDWAARASAAYDAKVLPGLDAQMALLIKLQNKATRDAGVWRLPDGEAYYSQMLANRTTTTLSPAEMHKMGIDITAELSARADVLFKKLGITKGTVGTRYDSLYKKKAGIYPNTDNDKARLVADLNKLVQDMQTRLPQYFGTLPRTPLEIRRIPKETEPGASTHYSSGSLDGTRPGIYWINLRDTAEAPFWWMPTTTFHEGVPGHHLQITLQQEADLPLIRKASGFGAYAEGWALYAEQVAQEMDFYKDQPLWELGYIHDALLRSGRLVTDTGLHSLKWSREKSIAELSRIDGDPISLSTQEIERYCVWPGQACSYMVGKLTILRLRDKARTAMGAAFDIRQFHDAVLLSGSVPLTVLGSVVDGYIASKRQV